ncbi:MULTISPECIES: sulfotransferase family protein [Acidiphilium]|uniref:Sulfotransferase family protein n=1 Tax=Acidiphilium rubrum TaxID=526 RepID=A0A8G2CKQ1_ACIRU|nr:MULTISPECIES: sulfotransferase family protein [Acidiphilium]SIQ82873.1 hypothetical protein SAMN05421828_11046 [Acidiphilium rubrum]
MDQAGGFRQAILVLGMHRSGTSALTRVISLCGADLPATLMPPAAGDNETGFWEPQALVDLHDEVLAAMGSSWRDVRGMPADWFDSAAAVPFRERLAALLVAEYRDAAVFVVKDPRLCRLLPLWLPVLAALGIAPRVVVPVRHPLEVAASLHRREGFDAGRAQALWRSHVLVAERESRGLVRCFVTYDQLMTDWRVVVRRIGAVAGADWLAGADAGAIEAFLSADLRHHAVAGDDGDGDGAAMIAGVAPVFDWLVAAAAGDEPDGALMDRVAADVAIGEAYFGPVIAPIEAALAKQAGDLQHWIDAAVERYAVIEDLRREIDRLAALVPGARPGRLPRWVAALRRLVGAAGARGEDEG